jgi:tRNA wybutosine-synthesizing protein 1
LLPEKIQELLEKQKYRLVGAHSAVKVCYWTKQSLTTGRVCYKELCYPGVNSHRCMEMTPFLGCNYRCSYCWRIHSDDRPGYSWKEFPVELQKIDEPSFIIDEAIRQRKKLLIGLKGNPKVDKKKLEEALEPTMLTLSLTGEPTLYPRLDELIGEAKRRSMTTFLVTNGSLPEVLEKLNNLPTQLYVSVSGADKETYLSLARPVIKDAWERFNRTLELLPSLNTRKVLRLTMVKGYNMKNPELYAKLIEKAEPTYVEVKAYEWVGESQKRLPKSAMPYMEDIEAFAKEISKLTSYSVGGSFEPSGVVMLKKQV